MSLVSYTNYTSYKPVANLNAKVKRLVKKTKKVEEKPEFRFFPRNAHKRIKLPPPTFDFKKEAEKVKQIMERRTPEDEESIRNHDESAAYAVHRYVEEHGLEFKEDELNEIIVVNQQSNILKKHLMFLDHMRYIKILMQLEEWIVQQTKQKVIHLVMRVKEC